MDESVNSQHVDIAIIGAGPVGSAVALGLSNLGLRVVLLEARDNLRADERRTLALSHGSREILETIQAWPSHSPTYIKKIHVTDKGHFGQTILTAEEMELPALGYVLKYNVLVDAMLSALSNTSVKIETASPVTEIKTSENHAEVVIGGTHPRSITASLAILADGGKQLTASLFSITHDSVYKQVALVAQVTCSKPHEGLAYERFTAEGPVALLPFEDHYALVWTGTQEKITHLLSLSESSFLNELQKHFGYRAGEFLSVGARNSYPLTLKVVGNLTQPHLICIGNAAQTMHPVAGQGFNLGLRDAQTLFDLVKQFSTGGLGGQAFNEQYQRRRRLDRGFGIGLTHLLVTGFSNNYPIINTLRNQILFGMNLVPPMRRMLTKVMLYGVQGILK